MSYTIDCPHCGHEHEPTGCHETDEGDDKQCSKCEKYFDVEIEYHPSYSTSKPECKESDHVWGDWRDWFDPDFDEGVEIRGSNCINCDRIRTERREKDHS